LNVQKAARYIQYPVLYLSAPPCRILPSQPRLKGPGRGVPDRCQGVSFPCAFPGFSFYGPFDSRRSDISHLAFSRTIDCWFLVIFRAAQPAANSAPNRLQCIRDCKYSTYCAGRPDALVGATAVVASASHCGATLALRVCSY
jgi:hypothetical protein